MRNVWTKQETGFELKRRTMRLATIATAECKWGFARTVASLRAHGCRETVHVFVPEGYEPPPPVDGTEIVACKNWWRDLPGAQERDNTPAFAKPEVMLWPGWQEGDSVLYFDASDVLFFCDPVVEFPDFNTPFAAYDFEHYGVAAPLGGRLWASRYYNNGVWAFRVGDESRRFGHVFAAVCMAGAATDRWKPSERRPIVGDQEAFNAAAALMPESWFTQLPNEWNYRGATNVNNLVVQGNVPYGVNQLPVKISHSTGGRKQPRSDLVELATRPFAYEQHTGRWAIVIPAHGAATWIDACLESLPDDVPVLVGVDGCPETLRHLVQAQLRPNVGVWAFVKVGPYVIRNTLAEQADAERILFFDADDYLTPDGWSYIWAGTAPVLRLQCWDREGQELTASKLPYAHGAFGVSRKLFLALNGFQPWPLGADSEFQRRVENMGALIERTPHPVFVRRRHEKSLTRHPDTGCGSVVRQKYARLALACEPATKLATAKGVRVV